MSTRAVYTFIDEHGKYAVYKHFDGYPEGADDGKEHGAYAFIKQAKSLAWDLPRFDASEFAAAFVAKHKVDGGGVYLTKGHRYHGDLSYRYEIRAVGDKLEVKTFNCWDKNEKFKKVYL